MVNNSPRHIIENEQPLFTSTHWTFDILIKTTTYDVGNPGLGLGQAQTCDRVKCIDLCLCINKTFLFCRTTGSTESLQQLSRQLNGLLTEV